MTKREWQIEMANRFAKRDNVKELEAKLECYERLVDSINMASNPMSEKGREALRNVREMKTIMTKEEEILRAVEAEREACAEIAEQQRYAMQISLTSHPVQNGTAVGILNAIRARGQSMTKEEEIRKADREWVGLTDEEANELWESTDSDWELMKRVEAKLKGKNT